MHKLLLQAGYPPVLFDARSGSVTAWYWVGREIVTIKNRVNPGASASEMVQVILKRAADRGVVGASKGSTAVGPDPRSHHRLTTARA